MLLSFGNVRRISSTRLFSIVGRVQEHISKNDVVMYPARSSTPGFYSRIMLLLVTTVLVLGVDVAQPAQPASVTGNNTLIVTTILDEPYLMLRQQDDGVKYEGYCVDLIEAIAKRAGFNYTIQLVKDGAYGRQLPDGTWTGMIGEVIRNEADLALGPLTITAARERVVDFTRPFKRTGISMMLKRIIVQPITYSTFLLPFTSAVWLTLLFACPVVGLLRFAIARYNPAEKLPDNGSAGDAANKSDVTRMNLVNSMWYSIRTMLLQGTNTDPRSISLRTLSAVWWLFVIFILAFYIAQLVTIRSKSAGPPVYPVSSVDDLAQQTEIKYGVIQGGSTYNTFRTSAIPVYQKMWQTMSDAEPSVFVQSTAEGVKRVRESRGKFAFLMESSINDFFAQTLPCDTVRVGPPMNSIGYGIAVKMGSPLRDKLSGALLELNEEDFLSNIEKKWWQEKGQCSNSAVVSSNQQTKEESVPVSLDIADVAGVFIMLLIGIVLAVIIAIVEFLYARAKSAKKPETQKTGESQDDSV